MTDSDSAFSLKYFVRNNAIKTFVTGSSGLQTSRLLSMVGKQLVGKYPLDTSSSCGKSLDLFVTVMCLWLVGWLVGLLIA